jgi:uncharacterized protein (DUF302 family)
MADGLITFRSRWSVSETIDRLAELVVSKGLSVFARIDHAKNAHEVSMDLRPTELLIFGNPRGGTPLMQDAQTIGLALPLHLLAWEDASGATFVSYEDIEWLARRHALGETSRAAVQAIHAGLAALTHALAAEA